MKSAQRGGDFVGNSCDNIGVQLNSNYIRGYFYLGFRGYGFDFIPHDILYLFVFTIRLRVMDTNDTSNILVGHYPEDRPCWDAIPAGPASPRIYSANDVPALKSGLNFSGSCFHFRFWFCLYLVI